jgi:hypothetical protein
MGSIVVSFVSADPNRNWRPYRFFRVSLTTSSPAHHTQPPVRNRTAGLSLFSPAKSGTQSRGKSQTHLPSSKVTRGPENENRAAATRSMEECE